MEGKDEETDKLPDSAAVTPFIKKCVLPFSVILSSWFCGIIACGATCSFAGSPSHVLTSSPSAKVRFVGFAWGLLAILLGTWVGLHVGKDVRRRYRVDQSRKDHS